MSNHPRIKWGKEQVLTLRALYRAGLVLDGIAARMGISSTSVNYGLTEFKIATRAAMDERHENMIRDRWGTMHPGKLAQVCRIKRDRLDAIAERLGLVYVPETPRRRNKPSERRARLQWAFDNRRTDREAGLIWDMARTSLGEQPTGGWY